MKWMPPNGALLTLTHEQFIDKETRVSAPIGLER
jgi:hypothetical protein